MRICFDLGHVPWYPCCIHKPLQLQVLNFINGIQIQAKASWPLCFTAENNMQKFRGSLGLGKKCRNHLFPEKNLAEGA